MRIASVLACWLLVVACSKAKEPPAPSANGGSARAADTRPATSGWYRAVLGEQLGVEIPFFLHVPADGEEAEIAIGPDRVRVKLASRPPKLGLVFDILHTRIDATAGSSGVLEGAWTSKSVSWGDASLSFRAEPIARPEEVDLFSSSTGGPDPVGVWKLAFPDHPAKLVVARGAGRALTATLAFPTGNLAFLAGNQDGRTLRLAAFDGGSPYLLVVELDDEGTSLAGSWTAGQALGWQEELTGARTGEFELERRTKVSARPRLEVPQLEEPPYKGKPVIVELGGSWCPACGYPVPKLRELQATHAKAGLQILGLAYELTDDSAYNRAQTERFKARYDIPWEVVPVDGDLEKYAEILPKGLEGIDISGFPVAVFVARDGTIAGVHSGFPRDQWGEVYEHAIAEYDRLAAVIAK